MVACATLENKVGPRLADVAQLVERQISNLNVVSSRLTVRSKWDLELNSRLDRRANGDRRERPAKIQFSLDGVGSWWLNNPLQMGIRQYRRILADRLSGCR